LWKEKGKLFWDANKFSIQMPINYLKFSSKAELIFDFLIPAIITTIILVIINIIDPSVSSILKGIKEINTQILTFISILAGFNITSISVLATAGSKLLIELKKSKSKKAKDVTLFEIMMTFFSAAIVTQFFIILIGVFILIVSSTVNIPVNFEFSLFYWCLFSTWIYTLLLTIFISIRNLKTLHHIMVYEEY
jgi:hypothetical protein